VPWVVTEDAAVIATGREHRRSTRLTSGRSERERPEGRLAAVRLARQAQALTGVAHTAD
jgi:hypothetical protein